MQRADPLPVPPAAAPDLASTILLWARPFMEGCVWTNRRYRAIGDQDEMLLYLAAWHFLMNDIAASRDLMDTIGGLPATQGLATLSPDRFRASSLASLVEETGIPRQTARRKVAALVARGTFIAHDDSTFRLARMSDEIFDLSVPAFGLARWMLTFHGWPVEALGEPKSLRSFNGLIRSYLSAYLMLAKQRRIHTGGISQVPIQFGLMLMHVLKVEQALSLEGPPRRWDVLSFAAVALRLMGEPYALRDLARTIDLPLSVVRSNCRRLADVNGLVTLLDAETLKVGGPGFGGPVPDNRRFYSLEIEQRLSHFTARVLARARRLASSPRPL